MHKDFLSYDQMRNNTLKLGHQIIKSGFVPDVIYVSLRGGAYMGNILSEYFKIARKGERPIFYAAVVARSYTDIRQQEGIHVDGWTYSPDHLRHGDKILLVDDIFDSGNTINHLVNIILEKGIPREDIKVAVHDYKIFTEGKLQQPIHPDFYCRKHIIEKPEEDKWIHYMSHELVGLTRDELEKNYFSKDEKLREVFDFLGE
ncbi:phosphoribosyltransferase [Spirochaeta cellobiosiphila]|uniref:phosphoribosyltransferase n=1 Tax=Spirochaeta cellobiosiphila TaxID=504483 RepID=UPI000424E56D|nr:phosphoribosyltransferase family protein [Spirochaeta cellobiosiphila]